MMSGEGARPGGAVLRGRRQVLLSLLCCCLCAAVSAQIQYSIPEEMKRGSIVGNLAKDLGINTKHLSDRKLRVVSAARKSYFTLNADTGTLHVSERIDREGMCGEAPSCAIKLEAVAENPLNVFPIQIFIQDVNDNAPIFLKNPIELQIAENTLPGARISLGNARDPDIGINALQGYKVSDSQHFAVHETESNDGYKSAELVLESALDREKESHYHLVLTAYDGGDPVRSSTVDINIKVLDLNDNFPVFTQETYRATISEGAADNSLVLQVRATDSDEGSNAKITYSFNSIADSALNTFSLDPETGEIRVKGPLDFEHANSYKMSVEAKDGGGHVSHCRVIIEVFDENDNAPEITFSSITSPVPENPAPDTVVALIKVHDHDSGDNGEVLCNIQEHLPFKLISSSENYYKLVTVGTMDRETVPEYNITVTATDKGSPPLVTSRTIRLQLSDLNDNPPIFDKASYQVYVPENTSPGASIYRVIASDVDVGENSHITYAISNHVADMLLSSYISINSQTGVIYAQRSYDYEQLREFEFQVKAQDSGSPPLSSNVTVKVFIVDQNDNPPEILYPALGPDGSVLFEMVPPSSDPGYLITKVVAVDADSGHNAWLSYHLLHALESPLFRIGLHSGEIRTSRAFLEKDLLKQKVVILVKDNGQPPLSATVTLNMVFGENMQEVLPGISNQPRDSENETNLKVYLVVSLALISFLFISTLMLLVIIKCRKFKGSKLFESLSPALCAQVDPRFTPNYQSGTLALPYSYEIAFALDSVQNQFTLLKPSQEASADILFSTNDSGLGNQSLEGTSSDESLKQQAQPFQQSQPFQQAPPNTDWRFSQAQRPGTSGSQNSEEAGGWPNNQFETERLQAMILASANEGADGSSTLGGGAGTMGLSTRYGPQFTLQHVPDYRQNVYIPGSTATLTNAAGKRDGKSAAASGGNKKKSGKKEKK
ncbi:protocadherin gamma-B5-like isoform X10 [Ambystoma mexicanum]|uniref:protocadherin gamma-B5-like isoform X10 n=1 Tax=Ambystoma mexicanum TaxID=8296 RepID=UPI0037E74601